MSRSLPRRRGGTVHPDAFVLHTRWRTKKNPWSWAATYSHKAEVEHGLGEFYDTYDGRGLDYVTSWISHTVDATTRHHPGRRRGRRQRNRDRYKGTRAWFAEMRRQFAPQEHYGVTNPWPPSG